MTAIAAIAFTVFVALRAARVPLTYDEAAAYLRYISSGPLSVFDFSVATNHFLNTLASKLISVAVGDSELALRMPSLIGYGLYVCFSLFILRELQHRAIACAGFLLLNLNPYVLDYFSLSRGYGLSLGLLAGALFFLLRFLKEPNAASAGRQLSRSLFLACAAVLANFAVLNVYLALFVVGFLAMAMSRGGRPSRATDHHSPQKRRSFFLWFAPIAVCLYALLILSQDLDLSDKLYEPVTVRIVTLNDAELDTIKVYRIDHRGRTEPLQRHDHVWRLDGTPLFYGLRIELPVTAAGNLGAIEVVAGSHLFRHDARSSDLWSRSDAGSMRTLESRSSLSLQKSRMPAFRAVINWRSDSNHARHLAARTAVVLLIMAGLALLLYGAGRLAANAGLLPGNGWHPLFASAFWTAALAGLPLYLLQRNGELYYGGTNGLVADTFDSIIQGSFYGSTYHADQSHIVLGGVAATIGLFGIALGAGYRRGTLWRMLPGIALLGLIVIVLIAVLAERLLFLTPYPLGRTALFFIPLYVLFVLFAMDGIADLGRPGRLTAASLLALALSVSLYHFLATANLQYTFDWRSDAATKTMIADLVHVAAEEGTHEGRVSLGVDWIYYPAAVFYARRQTLPIDVHVLPRRGGTNFLYVEDRHRESSWRVIREYAVARSILARPEAAR